MSLYSISNLATGISSPDCSTSQRVHHDAAGSDHRSGANVSPVKEHAVRSDPDIVLNDDATLRRHKSLLTNGDVEPIKRVIGRHDGTAGGDQDIVADVNAPNESLFPP